MVLFFSEGSVVFIVFGFDSFGGSDGFHGFGGFQGFGGFLGLPLHAGESCAQTTPLTRKTV